MASVLKKLVRRDARNATEHNTEGGSRTHLNHKQSTENKNKDGPDKLKKSEDVKEDTSTKKNEASTKNGGAMEVASMSLSHAQRVRTKRLMKEFHDVNRKSDYRIFSAELVSDNLYEWNVKLHKIDGDSLLHRDMVETGAKYILLNITFPENFPFAPPFMRVLAPRIEGGFVLDGGAICMELLTPKGWSSAYTVEAVILQFSAAVVKGKGRIDRTCKKAFSRKEAESAFKRLVKTHEKYGWVTPPKSEG
ncbi:ubiquitin-conjugating enzyme E2Q-like protein 1 [Actinia tenebrosa]|uniref:E2 ubiquitin-conjugating enzyme n=1 Tax=Actinia tenebrosa TaxID=6105 RepID=A0A6P8IUQ0_ACTTE|nr:ubiquitin-conjugating enzyme E2Q-like protein 1 [Actinia tenebrosa]